MAYSLSRLPSRFPVGTKFVIEGRQAEDSEVQIFKRFLEFPDGTHVRLPSRQAKRTAVAEKRRHRSAHQAAATPDRQH
jgi:hypothetical protein